MGEPMTTDPRDAPRSFKPLVRLAALAAILLALWSAPALEASGANPHTAESALAALRAGNARFVSGAPERPRQSLADLARLARDGQTPLAAVLACSDSRMPVETLFDMGFGDLFVIRAAGAVPGIDQIGSIEYAVEHLGVPVVVVLAHSGCGAVSAAVTGEEASGALEALLSKLSPVVEAVKGLAGPERVRKAVELSAMVFRERLPQASPALARAVGEGRLAIVSGVYDTASGRVVIDERPAAPAAANGTLP
jgi:carbonic anhydrase